MPEIVVIRGMLLKRHYLKILYSVVCLVAVYVVNNLGIREFPADVILHDSSVLKDHRALNVSHEVSDRGKGWHASIYDQYVRISVDTLSHVVFIAESVSVNDVVAHGAFLLRHEFIPHGNQYSNALKIVNVTGE